MTDDAIHILLVEDNPGDARLVETYLAEWADASFEVHGAQSLADAVALLKALEPDLVLLDLGLPDSNGIDTFTAMFEAAQPKPIVVMTGMAHDDLALQSVKRGAQDYLIKGEFDPQMLGRSVRYAIERAERHRAEEALRSTRYSLRIAREIQFLLFPLGRPQVEGFDIGGATFPASGVDGDYYDYLDLTGGACLVTIGDACGHGLGAALLSARAHACMRTLSLTFNSPGEMLTLANRVLINGMSPNRFVTMLAARVDPEARRIAYASAGHPAGYVINAAGDVTHQLASTGFPLGVDEDADYPEGEPIDMQSGDVALLLTDGVSESRSQDHGYFGVDRTLDILRANRGESAMQIVEALHDAVVEYTTESTTVDDITAVVIKCE